MRRRIPMSLVPNEERARRILRSILELGHLATQYQVRAAPGQKDLRRKAAFQSRVA